MKIITSSSGISLLRLDKGEELISSLEGMSRTSHLTSVSFTAIGAAKELLLSYYNLELKKYEDLQVNEDVEIISVIGNIAFMGGKPLIHAHGVFGKRDFSTIGGHIKKLTISATCEVTLIDLPQKMTRSFDHETGLNLLD